MQADVVVGFGFGQSGVAVSGDDLSFGFRRRWSGFGGCGTETRLIGGGERFRLIWLWVPAVGVAADDRFGGACARASCSRRPGRRA